jgi:hypothetical protein
LQETGITPNIYRQATGITQLQKPEKIYLENNYLAYTFTFEKPNKGNLRETFLVNQTGFQHQITYPDQGGFIIDQKYLIEAGGSKKSNKQINEIQDSFIAEDDIEFGYDNKIPLWLFGFLY